MTSGRRLAVLGTAWAASISLGLAFVFVRAPHPWGWEGFDDYRQLAWSIVRDKTYPTLERVWGYPVFLAAFYWSFGDRQWIPLVAQVSLNSLIPLMVYAAIHRCIGEREACVAAILVGFGSFTTIYASTQTSDSLAAVLFVAATVLMLRAHETHGLWTFTASGVAAGAASQLRPNLILLPLWFAVALWWLDRRARARHSVEARPAASSVACLSVYLVAAYALSVPWTIRNARLTGRFIPASTHGGIQLWYGSLQTPPFFRNWFDNPRVVFGDRVFDAGRPDGRNLVASAWEPVSGNCPGIVPLTLAVTFWTDRDPVPRQLPFQSWKRGGVHFEIPPQPAETAVYYYFDATWASSDGVVPEQTPAPGALDPIIYFVTTNDFGDQDRHGDFVDVFDVVRLVRYLAWHEPLPAGAELDFDRDGTVTFRDLDRAVALTMTDKTKPIPDPQPDRVRTVSVNEKGATVVLFDGSTLEVPRTFSGSVLDLDARGTAAESLIHSRRSTRSANLSPDTVPALRTFHECFHITGGIDSVFYRAEPSAQDRYTRLAFDNVSRAPAGYALAVLRRMLGVFVTAGSDNPSAAHQFSASRLLYEGARIVSLTVFALFALGMALALRRGANVALLAAAVFYVPVTTSPFLASARYALSAQPFVLGFVAVALVAAYDRFIGRKARAGLGAVP